MLVIEPGDDPAGRPPQPPAPAPAPTGVRRPRERPAPRRRAPGWSTPGYLAGHPVPLLLGPDHTPECSPQGRPAPPWGCSPATTARRPAGPAAGAAAGWRLLLYTDGLVEGRIAPAPGGWARTAGRADRRPPGRGLTRAAGRQCDRRGRGAQRRALTDDVAVLLLERNPAPLILG
ncbi:SpoIIE family protein phosphatase [Streptomyces lusitanus]|uniref:SpoIIE family protein phosphatase n=1 Tax=Streptomyces lusitanus TaxID=68232 RepID=UPI00362FD9C8